MKLLQNYEDAGHTEELLNEKVEDFKYLDAILSTQNDRAKEVGIRISKTEKVFFSLVKTLQV